MIYNSYYNKILSKILSKMSTNEEYDVREANIFVKSAEEAIKAFNTSTSKYKCIEFQYTITKALSLCKSSLANFSADSIMHKKLAAVVCNIEVIHKVIMDYSEAEAQACEVMARYGY